MPRTRLAIQRAATLARFAIASSEPQPHRACRALANQHGAPLAFGGQPRGARVCAGRGLGRRSLAMHAPSSFPGSKRSPPVRAPAPFPRWASLPDLHQCVHPCRWQAFRRNPNDASFGNRRLGALEHACGQSRGSRSLYRSIHGVLHPVFQLIQLYCERGDFLQDHSSNGRLLVQRKRIPGVPKVHQRGLLQQIHVLQLHRGQVGEQCYYQYRYRDWRRLSKCSRLSRDLHLSVP